MNSAKRKVAIERFMTYPSQIIRMVNRRGMEVIVYDEKGPIARLTPYKQSPVSVITNLRGDGAVFERNRAVREMMDISEVPADQFDQGGVWKISAKFRRDLEKPAWLRKLSSFSISGLLKKIREVETMPSSIRA